MIIRMSTGEKWKVQRVPRAVACVVGQPNRVVSGWEYTDHEGYTRFAEGNWNDLVYRLKLTAENYALVPHIS